MIEIPLTKGYTTTVDDEDGDLANLKWHADVRPTGNVYARRTECIDGKHVPLRMHRVILERILGITLDPSQEVDHKDGNGVNNRRSNLRLATNLQNAQNRRYPSSTGLKGVSMRPGHVPTWRAEITRNGVRRILGTFKTPEEAHEAYKRAALEMFGEFANFDVKVIYGAEATTVVAAS